MIVHPLIDHVPLAARRLLLQIPFFPPRDLGGYDRRKFHSFHGTSSTPSAVRHPGCSRPRCTHVFADGAGYLGTSPTVTTSCCQDWLPSYDRRGQTPTVPQYWAALFVSLRAYRIRPLTRRQQDEARVSLLISAVFPIMYLAFFGMLCLFFRGGHSELWI